MFKHNLLPISNMPSFNEGSFLDTNHNSINKDISPTHKNNISLLRIESADMRTVGSECLIVHKKKNKTHLQNILKKLTSKKPLEKETDFTLERVDSLQSTN
jgi:hypothetical protein